MGIIMKEIEVEEDKTINELLDELQFSSTPILLGLNGQVFYPDEIKDRRLRKGDKVMLIPLMEGG